MFFVDGFGSSNAMTWNFMADGIPVVYYGQEQGFSGNADPVCFDVPLFFHIVELTHFQYLV